MHDFVFHNPTKVIFGRNSVASSCGPETIAFGPKVLLVYGKSFAQSSGLYHLVATALQQAGAQVVDFGNVQPNPTVEHARIGVSEAKRHNIDVVRGLGGGSVIDTAKAIAAGALVEHDVWKFFTGKKSVRATLPVVALPTMAGSGSEMNSGMVLTNSDQSVKFGFAHRLLFPKVAIMDPQTTFSVSGKQTVYGAIDALSHLLEFYLTASQPSPLVQDRYMEGLASAITTSCKACLVDPENYEARAALMWGASLALNGMATAGLGKVGFSLHLIEHALSAIHDIPHGAGLAALLPGWLRHQAGIRPERVVSFCAAALPQLCSPKDQPDMAIAALEDWLRAVQAPTRLSELKLQDLQIDTLAAGAMPLARIWRIRDFDEERIAGILADCL